MSTLTDDSLSVEVSPATARQMFVRVIEAGHVPVLHGAPMTSKSSIARSVADEFNLHIIDCRLTTKDTVDISGMIQVSDKEKDAKGNAKPQQAYYVAFDFLPIEGTPLPKGKDGWLLWLDEIFSINPSMEVAAYQLILDHMAGMYNLHDKCYIAAAGNDPKHGAVSRVQGTAAKTRMVHIFVKQDVNGWINNWAYANKVNPLIIGFVREYPQHLTDFEPKAGAITYCGSRTLEMLNDLYPTGTPVTYDELPLIAGTIGLTAANDFLTFVNIYSQLEDFDSLMANPAKDRSNLNAIHQFMLVDRLIAGITTVQQLDASIRITEAFGPEYPVLLLRGVMEAKQLQMSSVKAHPRVRELVNDYKKYFQV